MQDLASTCIGDKASVLARTSRLVSLIHPAKKSTFDEALLLKASVPEAWATAFGDSLAKVRTYLRKEWKTFLASILSTTAHARADAVLDEVIAGKEDADHCAVFFRGNIPDAEKVWGGEPTAINEDVLSLIGIEGSKLFTEADKFDVGGVLVEPEGVAESSQVGFAKAIALPSLTEAMRSLVAFNQRISGQ